MTENPDMHPAAAVFYRIAKRRDLWPDAKKNRRRPVRRGSSLLVSIWLGVMSALSALGAQAAVDPSMLQALQWRLVGPFRGGPVLAVTGISGDSRHFYFGAVDGGAWSTEDA